MAMDLLTLSPATEDEFRAHLCVLGVVLTVVIIVVAAGGSPERHTTCGRPQHTQMPEDVFCT